MCQRMVSQPFAVVSCFVSCFFLFHPNQSWPLVSCLLLHVSCFFNPTLFSQTVMREHHLCLILQTHQWLDFPCCPTTTCHLGPNGRPHFCLACHPNHCTAMHSTQQGTHSLVQFTIFRTPFIHFLVTPMVWAARTKVRRKAT